MTIFHLQMTLNFILYLNLLVNFCQFLMSTKLLIRVTILLNIYLFILCV